MSILKIKGLALNIGLLNGSLQAIINIKEANY